MLFQLNRSYILIGILYGDDVEVLVSKSPSYNPISFLSQVCIQLIHTNLCTIVYAVQPVKCGSSCDLGHFLGLPQSVCEQELFFKAIISCVFELLKTFEDFIFFTQIFEQFVNLPPPPSFFISFLLFRNYPNMFCVFSSHNCNRRCLALGF